MPSSPFFSLSEEKKEALLYSSEPKIIALDRPIDLFAAAPLGIFSDPDKEGKYFLPPNSDLNLFLHCDSFNRKGCWILSSRTIVRLAFDDQYRVFIDYEFDEKDIADELSNPFELVFGKWAFRRPDPGDFLYILSLFLQTRKLNNTKILANYTKIQDYEKINSASARGKFAYYWDGFDEHERRLLLYGSTK